MSGQQTIAEYLVTHKKEQPIPFHMPGHKGRTDLYKRYGYGEFVRGMFGNDITEIPGADNLQQPADSILRVMENYAELYGVLESKLLVNGSSAGLMASILAAVPRGEELIVARNAHKSVFSALRLGGIRPVYVKPETYGKYNLQGAVSPRSVRDALEAHPDARAVLITSPNYYGVLSNVERIADIAHEYGVPLIVDQAHGSHLKFFDRLSPWKRAAENLGADIAVNSTHKTLLSLTGSSVLNICSDRIDREKLTLLLGMLQTTSPSYLLIGSLDINERILREGADELVAAWKDDLRYFYQMSAEVPGLKVIAGDQMDLTKINISMADYGLSGEKLERELRREGVWTEMTHGDHVQFMTGIGNIRRDYQLALLALDRIGKKYGVTGAPVHEEDMLASFDLELSEVPVEKESIPLYRAEGRVAYDPLIPYPPGIPAVCPGEILSREVILYLQRLVLYGGTVLGVGDEAYINVGK
ncbi:MAG: aminotransferase class V-fold PLP-dependent enzyme [Mogibacterium sp.]|nr:aminotransferase class V-fold PLP-dependent enzyme [Mogibacterium sp.]